MSGMRAAEQGSSALLPGVRGLAAKCRPACSLGACFYAGSRARGWGDSAWTDANGIGFRPGGGYHPSRRARSPPALADRRSSGCRGNNARGSGPGWMAGRLAVIHLRGYASACGGPIARHWAGHADAVTSSVGNFRFTSLSHGRCDQPGRTRRPDRHAASIRGSD